MRFFEFADADIGVDKFVMVLRNFIGRASSKGQPAKLNWAALQKIATDAGFEMGADYETFKSMYDSNPAIQNLVRDFNADGVNLNVPGTDQDTQTPQKKGQTSQDQVDQTADSAAAGQLAAAQSVPKI
jgi:hypothetical protein